MHFHLSFFAQKHIQLHCDELFMEFPASTLWCCRGQRLQMVSSTFKVVIPTNSQATSDCTDSIISCGIHRQVLGLFHRCKYITLFKCYPPPPSYPPSLCFFVYLILEFWRESTQGNPQKHTRGRHEIFIHSKSSLCYIFIKVLHRKEWWNAQTEVLNSYNTRFSRIVQSVFY